MSRAVALHARRNHSRRLAATLMLLTGVALLCILPQIAAAEGAGQAAVPAAVPFWLAGVALCLAALRAAATRRPTGALRVPHEAPRRR